MVETFLAAPCSLGTIALQWSFPEHPGASRGSTPTVISEIRTGGTTPATPIDHATDGVDVAQHVERRRSRSDLVHRIGDGTILDPETEAWNE